MLYMLMILYDPSQPDPGGPPKQPEHHKLELELRERGVYVSGAGLWPIEQAKIVQMQDGRPVTIDGPFAETKEALGGYFIVDCDEDEASAIAGRIPTDERSWIQVRPIFLFHPNAPAMASYDNYVDPRLRAASS